MRRARASSGRQVAAAAAGVADVTAESDTVVAGVMAAAASDEAAATSHRHCPRTGAAESAAPADSLAADLIAQDSARYSSIAQVWAGLDSNQRRRKASRFTVCPVWPLRYLPVLARGISYILAPHSLQLAGSFCRC